MRKITLIIIALIIFLITFSSIVFVNAEQIITKKLDAQEREYDFMWTKAICNESFCQDYEIRCKNNQLVSQTPITGAILVIDNDWEDPRPKEMQEFLC